MVRVFRWLLWLFSKAVLSLRYRVAVHGLESVRDLKGPVLILPNHPGYIDPVILLTVTWPRFQPRPMMFASNFNNPLLYPVMKLLNALEVPDLDRPSKRARAKAREAVNGLIAALRQGENAIMWPAGRVERNGQENLGGASALTDILTAVPEANILLVRTRGVFGSMFSYAQTGKAPPILRTMLRGLGILLSNFLLFTPRRKVDVTVEKLDRSQLPELKRELINPWFEKWYNQGGPEKPTYRPYHFLFGRRTFDWPKPGAAAGIDLDKVKPETKAEVNEIIARKLGRRPAESELRPETPLEALKLDSLDRMDLNLRVEQRFGFSADEVPATVGELWALAEGLAQRGPARPTPPQWFHPPSDTGPVEIKGETFAEAFVTRALANRRDVAAADDMAGVLTYERMLVGALTMAKRFATLRGENVGLLLPSSVACDIAFMALHLAGKLPVLLNWTTGQTNLQHAVRTMNVTHVVTSEAFLDRLDVELDKIEYVYLEDLRQGIGKVELLRTLLGVRWFPKGVRKRVPPTDPDRPAVVLFTSGSEKAPKAVPLTHRNVLSNLQAGMAFLRVSRADSLLAFLPAFHSFGMSVTGVLPLVGGLRVVRHPDPTDAGGITRKVVAYKPHILVGTPTFVNFIFERAREGQLASLKLIIVGAEKCPPAVFERCKAVAPQAKLLEGYGITECSPVVSVNPPDDNRPGTIGKPLPNVDVCAVDLESDAVLGTDQQGMLLVSGPSVFPGYIGGDTPPPFQQRDGKRWYVTGDLARIDRDGYLHFAGRLKRFLKAGGEMISLPALEDPLARLHPATDEGPRVAVEGVEQDGDRRIVLFTTVPMTLQEANDVLEKEGFRGVMRLTEVRQVDRIPVLGTGKTDYKVLRQQILEGARPA
jgi:long-chain-fatty-acid--[acyl-carrier-protein] ligase